MSEPSGLAVILEPSARVLGAVFTTLASVHWSLWFSRLGSLLIFPWRIVRVPLFFIAQFLLVVLSPILYPLSLFLAIILGIVRFIASLEPLYTFFGVAAVVGILTGLVVVGTSAVVNSQLGLEDDSLPENAVVRRKGTRMRGSHFVNDYSSTTSSRDTDWQWLEPSSPIHRRPPSGLLSQTIHEEEDSNPSS